MALKLEKGGLMEYVMRLYNDGYSNKEIAEELLKNAKLSVSIPTIKKSIEKYLYYHMKAEDKPTEDKPNAQDILYDNRTDVINMVKSNYFKYEIANRFGVRTEDVEEFLSKNCLMTESEKTKMIMDLQKQLQELPKKICDEIRNTIPITTEIIKNNAIIIPKKYYAATETKLQEIQAKYENESQEQ